MFAWGGGAFLLPLLPTLPVSDFLILENRLYVPIMGVLIALLSFTQARERGAGGRRRLELSGGILVLGLLSYATWRQGSHFKDARSFTEQAILSSPHLARAHLNRGIFLHRSERIQEAEKEYRTALSLDAAQSIVHNNLGLIELGRGHLQEAEAALREEIAINPGYDKAHFNLGLAMARQGRHEAAIGSWRQAVLLQPRERRGTLNAGARTESGCSG